MDTEVNTFSKVVALAEAEREGVQAERVICAEGKEALWGKGGKRRMEGE